MHKYLNIFILFFYCGTVAFSQDSARLFRDTTMVKGQFSIWGNLNSDSPMPLSTGVRCLPDVNYSMRFDENKMVDFEGAANIFISTQFRFFDSVSDDFILAPYRLWARYSAKQIELRVGLQKINFGSATLLRPLMWFDQQDPRDPLGFTNGVFGALGRYYLLNNKNIWIWCLYGNRKERTWNIGKSSHSFPEIGGRIQTPVKKGEIALTYHYRKADNNEEFNQFAYFNHLGENRLGFDGKWDLGMGVWIEGVWIRKSKNIGWSTHQKIINVGTDYTFTMGNGLNVLFEQLTFSYDEKEIEFNNVLTMSALSMSYLLGISDHLTAISYFEWKNNQLYSYISWKHQFPKMSAFLMVYYCPEKNVLPQLNNSNISFAGYGVQLMLVYDY